MKKETYYKADDLIKCIWGNEKTLRKEKENLECIKKIKSPLKGENPNEDNFLLEYNTVFNGNNMDITFYLTRETLIRSIEERIKILEEAIERHTLEFKNL